MEVLVTGANGQLAQTLKYKYFKNRANINFDFVTKEQMDISKIEEITLQFSRRNYSYCINCAAYTNVDGAESESSEAFKINADGSKNLALACKKYNVILIHISTDYVFDGKGTQPYYEDSKTNPINVYGQSKLRGESYIQENLDNYFIIRASWLYSPFGNNFVKTIMRKIENNEDLKIIASQKGTPTSCIDLSDFIFILIKQGSRKYGIYHFSALGETTWFGFARQIATNFKNYDKSKISPVDSYPSKATRPVYSVLNIQRAAEIFKFKIWCNSVDEVVNLLRSDFNSSK